MRSSGHFVKVCSTHIMPSLALVYHHWHRTIELNVEKSTHIIYALSSSLASHNWTQCWKNPF